MSEVVRKILALAAGLAIVVTGTAGCTSGARASQLRQVTEKIFPFEPGGELTISSQNGRVTVEAWNRPEARIQITREVRAGKGSDAEQLMKELRADVELGNGRISIRSRYPKRSENLGIFEILGQRVSSLNIHYYIQIPARTELRLDTSNGEVQVRGTTGELVAKTVNGSIDVQSFAGVARVNTTNGGIHLMGIDGSAKAGTTNGTVTAEMRHLSEDGRVELTTTNGDVTVMLPSDLRATLDAVTTNGRVSVGYALQRGEGSTGHKSVQGAIGGGGVPVVLRTTNGNITIRKVGSGQRT